MDFSRIHILNNQLIILFILLIFSINKIFTQDIVNDSIVSDTLKKKNLIDYNVKRNAKGYIKVDNKNKIITLFDEAELYYGDIQLYAGIIDFDWDKNIVSAGRIKDSLGNFSQTPVFKQGMEEINPDSLRYNFDSKKAIIWNSRTKQSDMNVISESTKTLIFCSAQICA